MARPVNSGAQTLLKKKMGEKCFASGPRGFRGGEAEEAGGIRPENGGYFIWENPPE